MIQPLFDGMLALLLAKFVLNDVPHAIGLTKGNGGGKEFEHFLATGKYLWKGVEYTNVPHQLEVDTNRGVLYLHNLMSGISALRVCRIPDDLIRLFEVGTVVIDLVHTPVRRGGKAGKVIKKQPAFLGIEADGFDIEDEAGQVYFSFRNVPDNLMKDLWLGKFVDITLGFTGRTRFPRNLEQLVPGDMSQEERERRWTAYCEARQIAVKNYEEAKSKARLDALKYERKEDVKAAYDKGMAQAAKAFHEEAEVEARKILRGEQ